jgi:hypothetical protein
MSGTSLEDTREAKDEATGGRLRDNDASIPDEHAIDWETDEGFYDVKLHPYPHLQAWKETKEYLLNTVALETRTLSFNPVSLLDRGESERLLGVSPTASDDNDTDDSTDPVTERETLSPAIKAACESLGFTIVPRGKEWIDR